MGIADFFKKIFGGGSKTEGQMGDMPQMPIMKEENPSSQPAESEMNIGAAPTNPSNTEKQDNSNISGSIQ